MKAKEITLESKKDKKKSTTLDGTKGSYDAGTTNQAYPDPETVLAKVTDREMKQYLIFKLHDDTDFNIMDCRKAMVECSYDIPSATAWLNAHKKEGAYKKDPRFED